MSLSEMYHVGIVVPDLEAGQAHLTELLGTIWGPIVEGDVEMRDGAGKDLLVPNRICYSTGFPYLELIQEAPGTPWVCNEHSNLHHIGFYATDLGIASGRLSTSHCPLEISGRTGADAPTTFTYHRDPLGVRIEFVDAGMRETMEQWLMQPPQG